LFSTYFSEEAPVDIGRDLALLFQYLFHFVGILGVQEWGPDRHHNLRQLPFDEYTDKDVEVAGFGHDLLEASRHEFEEALLADVGVDHEAEHHHGEAHQKDEK